MASPLSRGSDRGLRALVYYAFAYTAVNMAPLPSSSPCSASAARSISPPSAASGGTHPDGGVPWSQVGWTVAEARLALGDPKGALEALETFGGVNPGLWTLDRLK